MTKSKSMCLWCICPGFAAPDSTLGVMSWDELLEHMQNKFAGVCEDMGKDIGACLLCAGCLNFVAPDSTPGVMTWEECWGGMRPIIVLPCRTRLLASVRKYARRSEHTLSAFALDSLWIKIDKVLHKFCVNS